MPRIEVEPGYTVQPRYIDLEDGESLCDQCHGTGKVVMMYGSPAYGGNRYGRCMACHGDGKVAYCERCGLQRYIIKHDAPWMDTLCLDCIIKDERFAVAAAGKGDET